MGGGVCIGFESCRAVLGLNSKPGLPVLEKAPAASNADGGSDGEGRHCEVSADGSSELRSDAKGCMRDAVSKSKSCPDRGLLWPEDVERPLTADVKTK